MKRTLLFSWPIGIALVLAFVFLSPAGTQADAGWSCPAGTTLSWTDETIADETFSFTVPNSPWNLIAVKAGFGHQVFGDGTTPFNNQTFTIAGQNAISHIDYCKVTVPTPTEVPPSTTTPPTTSSPPTTPPAPHPVAVCDEAAGTGPVILVQADQSHGLDWSVNGKPFQSDRFVFAFPYESPFTATAVWSNGITESRTFTDVCTPTTTTTEVPPSTSEPTGSTTSTTLPPGSTSTAPPTTVPPTTEPPDGTTPTSVPCVPPDRPETPDGPCQPPRTLPCLPGSEPVNGLCVPASTTTTPPTGTLPETGSGPGSNSALAAGLVGIGAVLAMIGRRRNTV